MDENGGKILGIGLILIVACIINFYFVIEALSDDSKVSATVDAISENVHAKVEVISENVQQ